MQPLIFATNNKHKIDEFQAAIGNQIQLLTLDQVGIDKDIPEPHRSLEENAREKTMTIFRLTGVNCFSEDTGLEVNVLNNEPGVLSARYAGEQKDPSENIKKLLNALVGKDDRSARFRTVISLWYNGKEYQFEGVCNGSICHAPRGTLGFGYDPVFIPSGSKLTFAEMALSEKNLFSHRRKAADQLVLFLQTAIDSEAGN